MSLFPPISLFVAGSPWVVSDLGFGCVVAGVTGLETNRQDDAKAGIVRPLPWKPLYYAAADIYLVFLLYNDFSAKSWVQVLRTL